MDDYLNTVTDRELQGLHDEVQASIDQDLATRYALAVKHTEQNATEMDLLQYLISRGGNA